MRREEWDNEWGDRNERINTEYTEGFLTKGIGIGHRGI
jgi:hypothetical protein